MTIDTRATSSISNVSLSTHSAREQHSQRSTSQNENTNTETTQPNQVSSASLAMDEVFSSLSSESDVDMTRVNAIRAQLTNGTLDLDIDDLANTLSHSSTL